MAIGGRHKASKWLKMAINGPFVAISSPGGSKMVDQGGSRLDQGRTHPGGVGRDHFPGPEWPSGRAIRPQNGHNGSFVAISRSGGSKMVDQCGSRLDQGRTFIGFETSTWMISDTFLIVYGTVHLIISKQLELSSIYGLLFSFQ